MNNSEDFREIDVEDLQPKTVTGFREVAKPKHDEQFSTLESWDFQPWKTEIMVIMDEGYDPCPYQVYMRCKSPEDAQMMAVAIFEEYEKKFYGIDVKSAYPRLCATEKAIIDKLTEDQYKEFFKEAKKGEYKQSGLLNNPTAFVMYTKDWHKAKRIYTANYGAILVPDTTHIKKFNGGIIT